MTEDLCRPPMWLRRLRGAVALLSLAVLSILVAGCGERGDAKEPVREGIAVDVGGVDYNVFMTRQINPRDVEDEAYFKGPDAAPGSALYGVFLQACNRGHEPRLTARHFKILTTQDEEFEPLKLDPENAFAYRPHKLKPDECSPEDGSVAQLGPTGGVLLVFELPLPAAEDRPLELEIEGVAEPHSGKPPKKAVELDI